MSIDPANYDFRCLLVETVDEAQSFLRWLGERRPVLAIDTETTGLTPYTKDTLRVVQFGDAKAGWVLSSEDWKGVIKQALSSYEGAVVGHNWNFDRAFLEEAGLPKIPVHRTHDTMTMSHILNPARSHGLKQSADRYWPGASAAEWDLKEAKRLGGWDWRTIPIDNKAYWTYAASDVVWATRLAEKWWPEIQAKGYTEAYQRELAINDIAFRMQKRGMLIDTDYTSDLLDQWLIEMEQVRVELDQMGLSNPSAGQQVAAALQLTEDWEPDAWTETGLPKVDEKVLLGIDSEISRRVLRYRRLRKWTKAYLQKFLAERDSNGLVHPNLNPLRARTGRWSITNPPLQTLPRGHDIRDCVVAPEGKRIVMVDYNGMEMVGLAHYSQDPGLLAAIRGGEDLHRYVAREVYQDQTIDKEDARRTLAKNAQFCRCYGGGDQKVADTAGVELQVAKDFNCLYDMRFPGVRGLADAIDRTGRQRLAEEGVAYINTIGGRRLPCDDEKVYALLNYLIQGGMADIFKMKLIELDAAGFGDAMLIPVHDEVIFQFDTGSAESDGREALAIMEDADMLSAPLTCEASGPYERWGEKYRAH